MSGKLRHHLGHVSVRSLHPHFHTAGGEIGRVVGGKTTHVAALTELLCPENDLEGMESNRHDLWLGEMKRKACVGLPDNKERGCDNGSQYA